MKKINVLILTAASLAFAGSAQAQIFVANQGNANSDDTTGSIGEYASNGTVINSSYITGIPDGFNDGPAGLAVESSSNGYNVFVGDGVNGDIYEYANGSTSSPTVFATVPLNSGNPADPVSLAISGNSLIVADYTSGNILSYNLANPSATPTTLVSGLGTGFAPRSISVNSTGGVYSANDTSNAGRITFGGSNVSGITNASNYANGVAVSGNDLFVLNNHASVSEYTLSLNGTTASLVSAFSISNLSNGSSIAVSGNDLLVSNFNSNTVTAYSISGNGKADSSFTTITGLSQPEQIAVAAAAVPEPSSWTLGLVAVGAFAFLRRRQLNA